MENTLGNTVLCLMALAMLLIWMKVESMGRRANANEKKLNNTINELKQRRILHNDPIERSDNP